MPIDVKYKELLNIILHYTTEYEDPNRKGVFRKEIPFYNIYHSTLEGYPIISLRKISFKSAVSELLLFLKGITDVREYWKYGVKFWDKDILNYHGIDSFDNALEHQFSIGKNYPYQYRHLEGIDQIATVFDKFKSNPYRTDLVVSSWNVKDLKQMSLIPCHHIFQIVQSGDGFYINFNSRSVDAVLGFPINFQYYYLMGMILEKWSGHKFNGVNSNLNKVHIYDNQYELAKQLVKIDSNYCEVEVVIPNIDMSLNASDMIESLDRNDFKILNYKPSSDLKGVEMLAYSK